MTTSSLSTRISLIFEENIEQLKGIIRAIIDTPAFIRKHRLWEGFFENKAILFFTLFVAILFGVSVVNNLNEFINSLLVAPEVSTDVKQELKNDSKKVLDMGGSRFLLLVVLQVVIYFFCVKTLNILRSYDNKPSFKDYMRVQKRMILNMAEGVFKTFIIMLIVNVVFGIFGLEMLKIPVMFLVYSYFMAYAFLDDYNEQFGFSRDESRVIIKRHMGAALGFGLFTNILSYIPLLGAFILPFFAAITATLYAERVRMEVIEGAATSE